MSENNGVNLKDKIHQRALALRSVEPFPELGDDVFLRTMSGDERDGFEADRTRYKIEIVDGEVGGNAEMNLRGLRARFAVLVLADAQGNRIFEDRDAAWIGKEWTGAVLDQIYEQGLLLNRMDKEARKVAAKNSGRAETSDSGTISQRISGPLSGD